MPESVWTVSNIIHSGLGGSSMADTQSIILLFLSRLPGHLEGVLWKRLNNLNNAFDEWGSDIPV